MLLMHHAANRGEVTDGVDWGVVVHYVALHYVVIWIGGLWCTLFSQGTAVSSEGSGNHEEHTSCCIHTLAASQ